MDTTKLAVGEGLIAVSVTLYTRRTCPYCVRALRLLDDLQVIYREIPVDSDFDALMEMRQKSQRRTVPQIWIGNRHVGGCDELFSLHREGKLVPLVQADLLQENTKAT